MKNIFKKSVSSIIAMTLAATMIFPMGALAKEESHTSLQYATVGTTYYVDSVGGSDTANGTTTATPFKTLSKINALTLGAGDRVLLKAGSTFLEAFSPKGLASKESPIIVDMYNGDTIGITAGTPPHIKADGKGIGTFVIGNEVNTGRVTKEASCAVLIKNLSNITINNLEISNVITSQTLFSNTARTLACGVMVEANGFGVMSNVHLNNLNVHDVNGAFAEKTAPNGGIYFMTTVKDSVTEETRFDDISVTNCTVKNVSRTGISVGSSHSANQWENHGGIIPQTVKNKFGHTNVVIRNNYVELVGGDAIVPQFCISPLIEYNISNAASQNTKLNSSAMYNAGIWPWRCEDALFQYNEAYKTVNNGDGQAYDCDYSRATIYQYNYSHDNGGGFILVCMPQALDSVIRYNVSQNDLDNLFLVSNTDSAEVYNNTFYIGDGLNTNIFDYRAGAPGVLKNNIFYNKGTRKSPTWGGYTYDNNIYFGYDTTPNDTHKIVADPMFVDPGKGGTGVKGNSAINTLSGYQLQAGSPAIDAGLIIPNNGGRDYAGNPVGNTNVDIGAFEKVTPAISSDVYLYSIMNNINQTTKEILLDKETEFRSFRNALTFTDGATLTIKNMADVAITDGIVSGGAKIIVTKGAATKTYTVMVKPYITSDVYTVSSELGQIFITGTIPYSDFIANIKKPDFVTLEVKNGTTVVTSGNIETDFTLIAKSGTLTKTYTILKEVYNLERNFVGNTQGPIWFFETNNTPFATGDWHADWRCYSKAGSDAGLDNDTGKGMIGAGANTTSAVWVAPRNGTIEISQAYFAYPRRDNASFVEGKSIGYKILKNNVALPYYQIDTTLYKQTQLALKPVVINVAQGDRISFMTYATATPPHDGTMLFNPTVRYVNTDVIDEVNVAKGSTVTASSTATDYTVAGITDDNISSVQKKYQWKANTATNEWLNFAFTGKKLVSRLMFVQDSAAPIDCDVKCSFSDGTSVTIPKADILDTVNKFKIVTLPKAVNTDFVKMEFIGTTPALIGDIQILTGISKLQLQALYTANESKVDSGYTPADWTAFTTARTEADTILKNTASTPTQYNTAYLNLVNAVNKLDETVAIKLDLNDALTALKLATKIIATPTAQQLSSYDIDKNGTIEQSDVNAILSQII